MSDPCRGLVLLASIAACGAPATTERCPVSPRPGVDVDGYERGCATFRRPFAPPILGPDFNGPDCGKPVACVTCHALPTVGGSGEASAFVVEDRARCGPGANAKQSDPRRLAPPLFGVHLLDAIADAEIEAGCGVDPSRGVAGKVSHFDVDGKPARWGMKAVVKTIPDFVRSAFLREMGVCVERLEGVLPDRANCGAVELADRDVEDVVAFLLGMPAPDPLPFDEAGRALFGQNGCATCHDPRRRGTDQCLHDAGIGLQDDVQGPDATERDWMTRRLMGVRLRPSLLHDGRCPAPPEGIDCAIRAHGGEAESAIEEYGRRGDGERRAIVEYVETL